MYYTSREVYEYISKATSDPIVERKVCAISGTQFPIYQSDLDFYKKVSPTISGSLFLVPSPSLCPEERQRRRMLFRNERKLYRRTCDFSGKEIISIYSPDKPYKVYDQKIRWSDVRDPLQYGKAFDFTKTFTEQFGELMEVVPRANFYGKGNENSDYNNHCSYSKNCYMSADLISAEDCFYVTTGIRTKDVVDSNLMTDCENCYSCIDCDHLYDCKFCIQSEDCKFSVSLSNCKNCSDCINCSNLIGKRYCIQNIQYTKQEYELLKKDNLNEFNLKGVLKATRLVNSEQCYGNQIFNSKNVSFSHLLYDSTDIKYSFLSGRMKDGYDCYETGLNCSLNYETHAIMGSTNVCFMSISYENNFCYYLDNCYNCEHCFGCIGVRNKKFCIFNVQYSKDEYEDLVGTIIRHMQTTGERGEFFHPSLSPFGYNETVAQEYYPLTSVTCSQLPVTSNINVQEIGNRQQEIGFKRSTYSADPKIPDNVKVIKPKEYSDKERSVLRESEDITKQIIVCSESGRPFRIIQSELSFYRKHDLPLPKFHPDVRNNLRMKLRPGRTLHLKNCDKCEKEMLSVYAESSETTEKIYCEECYKQEIYG